MNLLKLSKYLAGELVNKKVIEMPDFIGMLENNIKADLSAFKNKYDGITTVNDYRKILQSILENSGEDAIYFILNRFGLDRDFIDFTNLSIFEVPNKEDLSNLKLDLLQKYKDLINDLGDSNNNKYNGNEYEEFIENFLLTSSYFSKGFTKEFRFEIGGQKVDRLLKLNKNILNINNPNLGYAVVEIKFKKDRDVAGNLLSVNDVPQFESYIKMLSKFNISKYGIFVCSSDFKNTAIEKFKSILDNENSNSLSFYISLITGKEIKEFLENGGNYENMSFDEFIERSFIKWLK